ncbi:2Fe-2S iron-sulfur cluster-binding protein [Chthonobacter albigriseus]|uniref:2Fe-2S iron-sulfur cluster-binding protein n=1 Tax=Chthonobacter albigriseus TaxID=1683161 RepID=UPI0015EE791E|nr:2Fe-2S iron-sulfur cluster binding domain-containing protein [Chthonobacter albigriseus]
MAKSFFNLVINGRQVKARPGDTLLDAALSARIVLPHDCCSGQCETCRVRLVSGAVDDQGTAERDTVLGCLATVEGDAEITFDPVPVVRNNQAVLEAIRQIGPDLLEMKVRPARTVTWLPGQYVRLTFKGYPPRDYSPTFPMDLKREEGVMTFHVRRYPGGAVSGALGSGIRPGHKVTIRGPFGNAFLRRQSERLVLVSTGTGFAPIWTMAVASVLGQPKRALSVIAGARDASQLYMKEAVDWLTARGVPVAMTASDGDGRIVRRERPSELLSFVSPQDVVYAAGAPSQVEVIRRLALSRGALFHADPFYAAEEKRSFAEMVMKPLRRIMPQSTEAGETRVS